MVLNYGGNNFDVEIAAYLLDSNKGKYLLGDIVEEYLGIDINTKLNLLKKENSKPNQITLFEQDDKSLDKINEEIIIYAYYIDKILDVLFEKLKETNQYKLFKEIEMPLTKTLSLMQFSGMYIDKKALEEMGIKLSTRIEELTKEIHALAGEEFNIRSPKQLGEILFEKLELPVSKKNKNGYSTDVDVLEKLKDKHPVIEKILEFRQIAKLNSTYVEGLIQFINEKTGRVHSYLHQTITATGRISSTEPNLQNIPIRYELGREIRKVFVAENENILIDADYSQIELRVLASMSNDEKMISQFKDDADIHSQTASTIFKIPIEEIDNDTRSKAKAVNFGIVYGITEFGLAGNIGISRTEAKEYIEEYLKNYQGIKDFMENTIESAKEKGYVETLFGRRRYIPELNSKNHMVREFGKRAALNTPIQGTAADIMKIAMNDVYREIKKLNLKSKLIMQIHDELIIETIPEEKSIIEKILVSCMEKAASLKVFLKADLEEGKSWFDAK